MRVGDSSNVPKPGPEDYVGRGKIDFDPTLMKKVEAYYEKSTGHKAKNSQEALGWLRTQLTPSKKEEERGEMRRAIDGIPEELLDALNDAYVAKNGHLPANDADLFRWFDQGK